MDSILANAEPGVVWGFARLPFQVPGPSLKLRYHEMSVSSEGLNRETPLGR